MSTNIKHSNFFQSATCSLDSRTLNLRQHLSYDKIGYHDLDTFGRLDFHWIGDLLLLWDKNERGEESHKKGVVDNNYCATSFTSKCEKQYRISFDLDKKILIVGLVVLVFFVFKYIMLL